MKVQLDFKKFSDQVPELNRIVMILVWYNEKNKVVSSLLNTDDLKPDTKDENLIWWSYFDDSLAFKPNPS